MKIYLVFEADDMHSALNTGISPAPMMYRIGKTGELYVNKELPHLTDFCPVICSSELQAEYVTAAAEEISRAFGSCVIDGDNSETLCRTLRKKGARAFCGEEKNAPCVISTAVSGGLLSERIVSAKRQYGSIAAEIPCVRMIFDLPACDGEGKILTESELNKLRNGKCVFFSDELMTWYFSFSDNSGTHFVLFDNAESIIKKLRILRKLGAEMSFLFYPQVKPFLNIIKRESEN